MKPGSRSKYYERKRKCGWGPMTLKALCSYFSRSPLRQCKSMRMTSVVIIVIIMLIIGIIATMIITITNGYQQTSSFSPSLPSSSSLSSSSHRFHHGYHHRYHHYHQPQASFAIENSEKSSIPFCQVIRLMIIDAAICTCSEPGARKKARIPSAQGSFTNVEARPSGSPKHPPASASAD